MLYVCILHIYLLNSICSVLLYGIQSLLSEELVDKNSRVDLMCPALNVFIQQGHLISVWHSPVWKRLPPSCSDCTCWFQVEPSALRPCWHYVSSPALVISAPRGFLPRSVQNATLCVFSCKSILVSMETRFANTSSLPNDPVLLLSFSPLLCGSVFFFSFWRLNVRKERKK